VAKPIAVVPKAGEIPSGEAAREELRQQLQRAPARHGEAILDGYALLQVAHEHGTLDLLRGLVGAGDDILGRIASGLSSAEAIRGMRNVIVLMKIAASLDPELLHGLNAGVSEAVDKNRKTKTSKPPTLWRIMKRFGSEDSRRALAFAADTLESVGKHLRPNSSASAE
jgi:uncharacterized protein YjgD (DUF1641 family)